MFCTWDTPRGRGSAGVSKGAAVLKSSVRRVSKNAEQSTFRSNRVSKSANNFPRQGFPLTSIDILNILEMLDILEMETTEPGRQINL